jgi:hypothetical protein
MSLSQPRAIFGVHSISPYSRTTGLPYGEARVVQGSTFTLEGDSVELRGGSNRAAWAVEDGDITAELAFSVSEYPNWLFELFGGKAPTQGTAEASGFTSAIANKKGTSIVAATGILAAITKTAADLKFGKYVLKATDVNTLDVYCLSDIDFGRGTEGEYVSDDLKIGTVDISTGASDGIESFGLEFTGGASATAFVTGDTATFEVRPVNSFNREVKIGGISDVFPEFGCLVYAQKSGSGAVVEIEAYKCKAIGLGLGAERKQFGASDYTAKLAYDSAENALCRIREIE